MAVVIAYFLIYVVWGSTYFFIGVCLRDFPPFVLGAVRFCVAGALLLAVCKWRGERLLNRRLIIRSAVCGVVLLFVDQAVIMFAQRFVSSSLVAIVASSTAVWIMLLDVPMWRRNFKSVSTVLGMVLGFAGVALLYVEQLYSEAHPGAHSEYGGSSLLADAFRGLAERFTPSTVVRSKKTATDWPARRGRWPPQASCLPFAHVLRAVLTT